MNMLWNIVLLVIFPRLKTTYTCDIKPLEQSTGYDLRRTILQSVLCLSLLFQVQLGHAATSCREEWTNHSGETTENLWDVAWGDDQFAAVGVAGTILTSPDGVIWESRVSGVRDVLWSIVWGDNKQFVVVGNSGAILTSPDGISWKSRVSGTGHNLLRLTWNGSQFVAVGNSGTILTSPDGISWKSRVSGTDNLLLGVTSSASQVAVVGNSGTILTSPDGVTWKTRTSGTNSALMDIAWNGSQFVAVGDAGTILTSPDGATWKPRTSGIDTLLGGIEWDGSQFIAVGDSGIILTSPDGVDWKQSVSGTTNWLRGIAWSGSQFVTTGSAGIILTGCNEPPADDVTPDPFSFPPATGVEPDSEVTSEFITVTGINAPAPIRISKGGTYSIGDGGVFTGQADQVNESDKVRVRVKSSADYGTTVKVTLTIGTGTGDFKVTTQDKDSKPDPFRFSPVTGTEPNTEVTSDPITVTGINAAAPISIAGGEYSIGENSAFTRKNGTVKVNDTVRVRVKSSDSYDTTAKATLTIGGVSGDFEVTTASEPVSTSCGVEWINPLPEGSVTEHLPDVIWNGERFVAVGDAGTILTSPDGIAWERQTSGTSNLLWSIAWNGDQFVAVGRFGTILTSADGVSWKMRTSGTGEFLLGLTWNGSQFIAVGTSGTILTSPDGVSWEQGNSGTENFLLGVAWSGKQFVIVGYSGTILTSSNGVDWKAQVSGTNEHLMDILWVDKRFIAVGDAGTILTSPDGVSWKKHSSGVSYTLNSIAWNGGQFIAVGDSGTILTSPDGKSWETRVSGTANWLRGIAWSGSKLVVTGAAGDLLTSCNEQPADDVTPDPFGFTPVTAAELNTLVTSESIEVTGINAPAAIRITGGEYSIGDKAFTSKNGSVKVNDKVRVRIKSSSGHETTVTATLTIGGVSGDFKVTTGSASSDTTPDPFSFTPVTGAELKTTVISESIEIEGINAPAPISITGGEYSIGDKAFTSKNGTVKVNDKVRVRVKSSDSYDKTVKAILTVGGVSGNFKVTTGSESLDITPDRFDFIDVEADPSQVVTSNPITVSGINAPAPISIIGGEYAIGTKNFTRANGTINAGEEVRVRVTSSANYGKSVTAILTIGGVDGDFKVVTRPPDCQEASNWAVDELADPVSLPLAEGNEKSYGQSLATTCGWLWIGAPRMIVEGQKNHGKVFWWRSGGGDWGRDSYASQGLAGDEFGSALAMNTSWAVVGAPKTDREDLLDIGRVYLYQQQAQSWQFITALDSPNFKNQWQFGSALALTDTWLAVGAPGSKQSSDTPNGDGAVYLYALQQDEWVYQHSLEPPHAGGRFGASLAMEGDRLIVGAPTEHLGSADNEGSGAVYAYRLSEDKWVQDITFPLPLPGDHQNGQLGTTIALQGNTLVISAPMTTIIDPSVPDTTSAKAGRVFLYQWDAVAQEWYLSGNPMQEKGDYLTKEDHFGSSLALGDQGQWLIVGAPGADPSRSLANAGRGYLYRIQGLGASESLHTFEGTSKNQGLGRSVALLPNTAVIGSESGQVWSYQPK